MQPTPTFLNELDGCRPVSEEGFGLLRRKRVVLFIIHESVADRDRSIVGSRIEFGANRVSVFLGNEHVIESHASLRISFAVGSRSRPVGEFIGDCGVGEFGLFAQSPAIQDGVGFVVVLEQGDGIGGCEHFGGVHQIGVVAVLNWLSCG